MIDPPFEDSRRLTGPNPYFAATGAALECVGIPVDDGLLARWRNNVRSMCRALGWPEGTIVARPHRGGASLAFAAPPDRLLCATEVNEWAIGAACGIPIGASPGHPATWDHDQATRTLHALANEEIVPSLLTLLDAASRRRIPALLGEDQVTLGSGAGGRDFPLDALPSPDDVAWSELSAVPAALVTGSNGKTTTVRLIAAMLRASGKRVGYSCTDGLFIAAEKLDTGDYSGPVGARTVLRRRDIDAAVLETARGGLLRRGLALADADVAVVTNVSADHFGEYGVHSLADLAAVKLTVARAVRHRGLLVLNADDVVLREAAAQVDANIGWFSLDADSVFLQEHAARSPVCMVRDGRLWLHMQGIADAGRDLGAVADMPLSVGGVARYNIANLAGAALAGAALGIEPIRIADVLARFGRDNADNRGRLERWTIGGVQVVLDYAHNPEGLAGLLDVATANSAARTGRLGLILGHAGNRLDEDIRALADVAARHRPDRVVLKNIAGYERGRTAEEIGALIREVLEAYGLSEASIDAIPEEVDAVRDLLDWAEPGDLLVLPIHGFAAKDTIIPMLDALARR
ncbi:Mur ligase family protein [Xanthomonadaceae bacterium JHOS43]|nr:Mur ligase family protein [Xanthomonadaceae bacterium JHOS43]